MSLLKTRRFLLLLIICTLLLSACNAATAPAEYVSVPPVPTISPTFKPFLNVPADTWIRSNPGGGGALTAVGAGPTGIILVGSDLSGAYLSRDKGKSWQPIGLKQGLTNDYVASVGFDTQDESISYLGTNNGIFRSSDGSQSFQSVLQDGYILDIKFSVSNPQVGYGAWHPGMDLVGGQIYKTIDRGSTWAKVSTNLPNDLRIFKIIISPKDENTLFLVSGGSRFACGENGLFRSNDGGVTWQKLGGNLPDVEDVALDGINPNTLYLTTFDYVPDSTDQNCQKASPLGGEIYRSDDQGNHWSMLAIRSGAIWLDPKNEMTIRLIEPSYVESNPNAGTWESVDGGVSWQQVGTISNWDKGWSNLDWTFSQSFNGPARTFGIDLSDPDALFWATDQFVYVTRDDGRHFENLYTQETASGNWQSTGVDNVVMFDLSISPANPQDIYLGFFDIGCWHSSNGGNSWVNCNDPSSTSHFTKGRISGWRGYGGNTTTILADPTRAGVVWTAQTSDLSYPFTLLRSNDSGNTWQKSNAGLPTHSLSGLSLDGTSPNGKRIMFITGDENVYKSVDDGWNWNLSLKCNGCWYTAVDHFNGNIVYAGGNAGLFASDQGGASDSWKRIDDPEFSGGGDNPWGTDFEHPWTGISDIVPSQDVTGEVYVTVYGPGKGLYVSRNQGETWIKLLADDFMRAVAINPRDPNMIYATSSSSSCCGGDPTNSHGILQSLDRGQTWKEVNDGMAWPFAGPIAIDPSNPSIVWAGSPGTGFERRQFQDPTP
jgi:photosystem II stability/assembly factor-like uncharacterized protein